MPAQPTHWEIDLEKYIGMDLRGRITQQEISVCGGLGFISLSKHCCNHFNTSSFMSAPWCYSVRNYFSEYTAF